MNKQDSTQPGLGIRAVIADDEAFIARQRAHPAAMTALPSAQSRSTPLLSQAVP